MSAASLLMPLSSALAQRESIPLSNGWKFVKQDAQPDASFANWEAVSVPHTWNALDGQDGKKAEPELPDGYYRGPAWYARELEIPSAWKGKRVFIRFEAASLVADVYLNGKRLGQHRGGFAAFCYELTPHLQPGGKNVLRVRVDNSHFDDIAPISGDFTVGGGIYRPVTLFSTDAICVTPLDHATSGVYLTQKSVTAQEAQVEVEAKLSNGLSTAAPLAVRVVLKDAEGNLLEQVGPVINVPPGATVPTKQILTIKQPHLWNGRKDPYVYTVSVGVLKEGKLVDEVTQPLGVRTVQIDQDKGFLLNGTPYALYGVNRHQERKDKGWAISEADHQEDHQLILDIGATCLRLAHYQQSDYFIGLCDKSGLVLWEEVPLVNGVNGAKEFNDTSRQQLEEMILQGYNHPSLAFWGLFNELNATWVWADKKKSAPPEGLITHLQKVAKSLDATRPTVSASWMMTKHALHEMPDWICFNIYPGWYWGVPADFGKTVDKVSGHLGGKRVGISEFGAGANISQHEEGELKQPAPTGAWHPEEWQAYAHEQYWAAIKQNKNLWGTYLWAMFDFASDGRDEGEMPGINDKGIITHDRKVKKDAFFFYQANWSERPMAHIAARRMTPRKLDTTEVKVYSNCSAVELWVNGKSLGSVKPDDIHICRWAGVKLQPGRNVIEIKGAAGDQKISDSCEWVLEAKP